MSGADFLDANVLVYAYQLNEPREAVSFVGSSKLRYNALRRDAMELPAPQRRIYTVLSGHMRPFLDRRKIPLRVCAG